MMEENEEHEYYIYLVTNETQGTVLFAFREAVDAVIRCKKEKESKPHESFMVVEIALT